jgi:hypothetical protein
MRSFNLLSCIFILAVFIFASAFACAGTFKDRDGTTHSWYISNAHVLVWDDLPYIPFGVVFEPKYLSDGQSDENLKIDEESVQAFKLAGIKDVIVRSSKGITSCPVSALQKIIDLLEESGLRYGVDLYDPPYTPINGYVVQPAVNRVDGITGPGSFSQVFVGSKNAIFVVCDAKTAEIKQVGQVSTSNGEATVQVQVPEGGNYVLLFYPFQTVDISETTLPDIWSDYDHHRDKLVAHLRQIKFGKGLRFFYDPFGSTFGISGLAENLIPSSTIFRIEYASWLSRRYRYPRELSDSWGILRYNVTSFEEAARLIPLWNTGRGVPAVYDPESKRTFEVNVSQSAIWKDFQAFRAESIRRYMDAISDVLKRLIADVPVVYTATGLQPIFQATNSFGFDGLCVPPTNDADLLAVAAGNVFSLADNSERGIWIVSRIGSKDAVFRQKEELFKTINTLHSLGAKGFFLNDVGGTGVSSADLLVWLAEYMSLSVEDKQFIAYVPKAVYYPKTLALGKIKRISTNVWWLPSLKPGFEREVGSSFAAYVFGEPRSPESEVYIWSLSGTKTITLVTGNSVTVTNVNGDVTEYHPKKGRVQFVVGEEPVQVKGVSAEYFLPIEAVEEKIKEFEVLIEKAEAKRMDAGQYRRNLKLAREQLSKNQIGLCWDLIQTSINELSLRMRGLENTPSLPSKEFTMPSSTVR